MRIILKESVIASDTPSEIFSLWADDSHAEAVDPALRKAFKAHFFLNYILNDRIILSDSQAITCRNFRHLVRYDAAVSHVIKEGGLGIASRTFGESKEGVKSLLDLEREFREGGKIRDTNKMPDNRVEELEFIEDHALIKPWEISQIGKNYAQNSKRILFEHFCAALNDSDRRLAESLVAEQEEKKPLDRFFLQEEFLNLLMPRLMGQYDMERISSLLQECYIAPYVSNLPSILDLTPIYLPEHKRSFQILRGVSFEMEDVGDPIDLRPQLDHAHYIEGICRLDIDDVMSLKRDKAVNNYKRLSSQAITTENDHEALQHAYMEANITIEHKMINRFPELRLSTQEPEKKFVKRQFARDKMNVGVALDLLGLCVSLPGIGTLTSALFDVYEKKKFGTADERDRKTIAEYQADMKKVERYLKQTNQIGKIETQVELRDTNSFKKEIIAQVIE